VTWQAHVYGKTSSKEAAYDMIMGMDLMTSIGITVDCEQRCIRWGEPDILQEAEKRQNRILDADYRKVEVDPFVEELKHLTMDENRSWVIHSKSSQHYLVVD
jgi:hypothetical protein